MAKLIRRNPASVPQVETDPAPKKPSPASRAKAGTPARTKVAKASQKAAEAPGEAPTANLSHRYQIEYLAPDEITPYPFNPRDNEKAIPAVAESIRNFGFLIPCVIDENNVLVAGHTRTEAAKLLGLDHIPCIRATGLSQEQINAFRLIDNKVAEQATWDHDLLAGEIGKLSELGFNLDYTKFGWRQEEIDCLSEVVAEECLTQTVEVAEEEVAAVSQRRAPLTTRIVVGDFVLFVPATEFRNWADGIRQLCDFSEERIAAEIRRRLGILEA